MSGPTATACDLSEAVIDLAMRGRGEPAAFDVRKLVARLQDAGRSSMDGLVGNITWGAADSITKDHASIIELANALHQDAAPGDGEGFECNTDEHLTALARLVRSLVAQAERYHEHLMQEAIKNQAARDSKEQTKSQGNGSNGATAATAPLGDGINRRMPPTRILMRLQEKQAHPMMSAITHW